MPCGAASNYGGTLIKGIDPLIDVKQLVRAGYDASVGKKGRS